MEIITTTKGKPSLVKDGYRYRVHKKTDEYTSWLCVNYERIKCRGRLKIANDNIVAQQRHSCPPDEADVEIQRRMNNCRKRVREEKTTPVCQIFKEEFRELKDKGLDFVAHLPNYENSKTSLCKARRESIGTAQNPGNAQMSELTDMEMLISLVQMKPLIWDRTRRDHRDKKLTTVAWESICEQLNNEFRDLEENEKSIFCKQVIKKWTNLRDSYFRSQKRRKYAGKSGQLNVKKYVYNDQLQFLAKIVDAENNGDVNESPQRLGQSNEQTSLNANVKQQTHRKRRPDYVESKILQFLNERLTDRHMAFFEGIAPSLDDFNEDEILQFQVSVLKTLASIKQPSMVRHSSQSSSAPHSPSQSKALLRVAGSSSPKMSVSSSIADDTDS